MFTASLQKYSITSIHTRKARALGGGWLTGASVALAAILTVAASSPARAATFVVNSLLDATDAAPGNGICSTSTPGVCTLRAAIQEANALAGADTILVPVTGVIKLTIPGVGEDLAATGDLDITDDLTIIGTLPAQTIVDGNKLDRVFDVRLGVTATIENLTIRNGVNPNPADNGGGIANHGTSLTLSFMTVEKNSSAGGGGGIFNDTGTLVLNYVIIRNNRTAVSPAGDGGGILTNAGTINGGGVIVANNKAGDSGGGIMSNVGPIFLFDALIRGNSSQGDGGGIRADGDLTVNGSVVKSNKAANKSGGAGGGILVGIGGVGTTHLIDVAIVNNSTAAPVGGFGGGIWSGNNLTIEESIVENNKAADKGGGIYESAGTTVVKNVTIAKNSAKGGGGGVSLLATATLSNVTMADNTAPVGAAIQSLGGIVTVQNSIIKGKNNCDVFPGTAGYNLDSANTCGFAGANDLPNTNPLLAPLAFAYPGLDPVLFPTLLTPLRVYALRTGSPAIDAGDNATCEATDQLGVSRPVDGDGDGVADCDLGALEMN
jgi:CSLREA domain-containing protein